MATVSDKVQISLSKPKDDSNDEKLPKLSEEDFRIYNNIAAEMEIIHNHFRRIWTSIYKAAVNNQRPLDMSIRTFIRNGKNLCRSIISHHQFEEAYIYPQLAQRIPAFAEHQSLLEQHKEIHEGLVKVEKYLKLCEIGEKELRMGELKALMDEFGEVLWEHLDEEVRDLGADVMRRYYSVEEFKAMWWRFM